MTLLYFILLFGQEQNQY